MRLPLAVGLGVAFSFSTAAAPAEDAIWRPVIAQTPARPASNPGNMIGDIGVALGRPVPLSGPTIAKTPDPVLAVSAHVDPADGGATIVRAQAPDVPPSGTALPPPPPGSAPVIIGDPASGPIVPPPPGDSFWGKCKHFLGVDAGPVLGCGGRSLFQSDHAFDTFISPVSNPFLFEDPRALTEVRPIFIYQSAPSKNWVFKGGSSEFFGLQARVALTERWSIVMNKLGGVSLQPNGNDFAGEFGDHTGFAEIDIGPKYTFLRDDRTGTIGAAGLTFQIPAGSKNVFQDTGSLSLAPYISMAQAFGHSQYGNFNAMGAFAYSFATDDKRSEYLNTSLHLDYDVANLHRIYPLVELNWYHYTRSGKARNLGFEGEDLVNFGSRGVSGHDFLSMAVGARFKLSEAWQFGIATEWPITGRKDITDFRLTIDTIIRY
jgi:hypothetical protein